MSLNTDISIQIERSSTHIFVLRLFLIFLLTLTYLNAQVQLIKKENSDSNTTLLVVAGIHGDEPGGYFAASILATHYNITSKNLWIVPNLNKESIQEDARGLNGDMNRKFSTIDKNDKDLEIVKEIKEIILSQNVSLVLNLHDGNGFYRKEHQGSIFNPNAWGQTCVIDQNILDENKTFGDLNTIALSVKKNINTKLLQEHHIFDVKNTNTKFHDEAMQHSLTYFAVTNNKPAFAIESSKHLKSLSKKVFYQLLAIEEFMTIMDISFERKFDLNENTIDNILKQESTLIINDNISFNFSDIKNSLSFIPIRYKDNTFKFSNPLGSVKKINGDYIVYIGNKKITTLSPQYFEIEESYPKKFDLEVDGVPTFSNTTSDIFVNDDFRIRENLDFRVNVIGFVSKKNINESEITINLKSLNKKFSVDNKNKVYRVEFYKKNKFCFMSMVHFK